MQVHTGNAIPEHAYLLLVASTAFLITVSMTIPFSSILIGAVLFRRDQWQQIVLTSSFGSAAGGLVLFWVFYHLGWSQIAAAYPDLVQSKMWSDAVQWISAYGSWALFAIAAMPLPHTPALIFTAMLPLPASHVFLALFVGKLLKYGIYGWLVINFPAWFQHLANGRLGSSVFRRRP